MGVYFTEADRRYAGTHLLLLDRRQGRALVTVILAGLEELAAKTGASTSDDADEDARAELLRDIDIVEHLLEEIMEAFPTYHPPGAPRTLDLPLAFH